MPPKKAVTKKAAKALLKQEKKEQKQKEKETKHKLKCEAFLSKALMKYEQTGHEADVQYICDQLQQTPQWVGPLARLIRHGALNALLKLNSGQEETTDGAERWQGKARKLLELPEAAKIRMLEECGVNLTHVKCDTDSLNSTFAMHFWVTENVPLPSQPDIRLMSTLVALAHARMAALPMAYFKEKDPTENNVKAMWQLEGNVLTWLYNDSREATICLLVFKVAIPTIRKIARKNVVFFFSWKNVFLSQPECPPWFYKVPPTGNDIYSMYLPRRPKAPHDFDIGKTWSNVVLGTQRSERNKHFQPATGEDGSIVHLGISLESCHDTCMLAYKNAA